MSGPRYARADVSKCLGLTLRWFRSLVSGASAPWFCWVHGGFSGWGLLGAEGAV